MMPAGSEGVITIGREAGGGTTVGAGTVKLNCVVAVCAGELLSVTESVKEKLPLESGVPEITPVVEDRVRPEGSWPVVTVQV
jgi:hypothetical protein